MVLICLKTKTATLVSTQLVLFLFDILQIARYIGTTFFLMSNVKKYHAEDLKLVNETRNKAAEW